jgi:hypothetical protein
LGDDDAVIATFRLAQQTSRWARFAAVTVDVVPAADHVITVLPQADDRESVRSEAACGARDALRHMPRGDGFRVTVTDIRSTDADTGVGDVYESAARAVWQALNIDRPALSLGFSKPDIVAEWLRDRVGLHLAAVTEARHWYRGERGPDADSLIHAWLHFDDRPPTRVHGHGDDLLLSTGDPYSDYEMAEAGEVRVRPAKAPDLLARLVGRRLTNAAVILGPLARPTTAGVLLSMDGVDVVIGTFCDEWTLATDQPPAHLAPYWRLQPRIRQG